MGYHQRNDPPLQGRLAYPGMYNSPTYVRHPSMGFQDQSWQQAPFQPQQEQPYPSAYASRRSSGAFQYNSSSVSSTAASASMTPSMSWNTSSQYGRNAGSPSMSNSFSSYASYTPHYETTSMTPVRPAHALMNATAPAFTPRLDFNNRSTSLYSNGSSPHFSSTPSKQLPSVEKTSSLPRLHRTAPSISLPTLNRPSCPPAKSPLPSRGASPVGSNFSTGTDGMPLLNSFGLPINLKRTYKVLLPLEVDELRPEETRKRTIWARTPLSIDFDIFPAIHDPEHVANVRSKSPHPEETYGPEELPENLEIYLPNDWVTLREALFEERMAKIGITTDYLKSMDSMLSEKKHAQLPVSATSMHAGGQASSHLRSESVFAAPFVPRWTTQTSCGQQQGKHSEEPSCANKHKTTMSMPEPAGWNGFMRQQAPFGPRELPSSRAASHRFARPSALVTAPEEEAEEGYEDYSRAVEKQSNTFLQETEGSAHEVNIHRPANSLTLQELSAGFGIISEADADSVSPIPTVALSHHNVIAASPPRGRIAIEGATGHTSLPESASLDGDMENGGNHLAVIREARKSVSAPDLHEKLVEQMEQMGLSAVINDQHHLDETQGEETDVESYIGTEYSNPSDEERARARRDQGLPTSSLSPAARLHNLDSWLDHRQPEGALGHASVDESLASHRIPPQDKRHMSNSRQGSPSLKTAKNGFGNKATELRPKGLTGALNPAAPPFVLGFKLGAHDAESTSVSSAFSRDKAEDNLMPTIPRSFPAKSSFSASESRFPFARKPALNVGAAEFKLRHVRDSLDNEAHLTTVVLPSSSPDLLDRKAVCGISTLNDAKSAVNNWLYDLAGPDNALEGAQGRVPPAERPSAQSVSQSLDNVRSFKFPASSPGKPAVHLEAPSAAAPQLPPFGTIGRNTFKYALEKCALESHDDGPPTMKSRPKKAATNPGHRSPIPDFGLNPIKYEPTRPSMHSNIPQPSCDFSVEAKSSIDTTSPLSASQTWPPSARPALALANPSKATTSEDPPLRQCTLSAASTSDSSDPAYKLQMWTAIQENRRLIESLVRMQDVSAGSLLKHNMATRTAASTAMCIHLTSPEIKALTADIVETVNKNMATKLDMNILSIQIVKALQGNLTQLVHQQREIQVSKPSGSTSPESPPRIYIDPQLVAQAVKECMSEAIPGIMDALMPSCIPIPPSPTLEPTQAGDRASSEELDLDSTLKRILLTLQDKKGTCAQTLDLEKTLNQVTSDCNAMQVECDRLRMLEESHRSKHSEEVAELRIVIGNKDKQIERLREELLKRATMVDHDTKDREALHTREKTEYQVLCKGLETELDVLNREVNNEKALVTGLQEELDEARRRISELESQVKVDSAVHAERNSVYREETAAFAQREHEHTTQMAIMQDILSKEAASRVQLEDRVQTAQEETTRPRQQLAEVQAQLSSTRVSEATLSSELRAAEKTIVEERQAFNRRESQFEQVLGGIQQANDQYADIARHAHSIMLETIFAITQASESVERRGDLVFETFFVENSSTVLDSKSNTPQKEVMSKDGLQSIVAEVE